MDELDKLIKEKQISEERIKIIKDADFIVVPLSNEHGEFINKGSIELFKNAKFNGFKAEYLCQEPQKLKVFEHYADEYVIVGLIVANIQMLIWIYKLLKTKELEKYLGSIPIFKKLIYKDNKITDKDANELIKKLEEIIEKNKK